MSGNFGILYKINGSCRRYMLKLLILDLILQVHTVSRRYHLFPLTLVNPIFQICQRQGIAVLWKGLGSTLVVRGMALAVEDVASKVAPWPK